MSVIIISATNRLSRDFGKPALERKSGLVALITSFFTKVAPADVEAVAAGSMESAASPF
jgi:hypothetical protein